MISYYDIWENGLGGGNIVLPTNMAVAVNI